MASGSFVTCVVMLVTCVARVVKPFTTAGKSDNAVSASKLLVWHEYVSLCVCMCVCMCMYVYVSSARCQTCDWAFHKRVCRSKTSTVRDESSVKPTPGASTPSSKSDAGQPQESVSLEESRELCHGEVRRTQDHSRVIWPGQPR
jgi:hypothetical protein